MSDDTVRRHLDASDREQSDQQHNHSDKKSFAFLPPNFFIESIGRCVVKDEVSPDQQQRAVNNAVKDYTRILMLVGVVSLVVSVGSCEAVRNQVTIMETDERPWVATPKIEGIGCGDKSANAPALVFKNVGKTVAANFFVTINVVNALRDDGAVAAEQSCQSAISRFRSNPYVIIPSDEFKGKTFFSDQTATPLQMSSLLKSVSNLEVAGLAGCAVYASGFDSTPHKTIFFAPIVAEAEHTCIRDIYNIRAD